MVSSSTVSESVRDLGVVVDSQLYFSEHIANIVRRRTKEPT